MPNKKTTNKIREKVEKKTSGPDKITLPAFGLAEDILRTGIVDRVVPSTVTTSEIPDLPLPAIGSDSGSPSVELHLVTFNLDREEYGVDIRNVQEVIRVGQITAMPSAPEYIKGVINLRGKVIPVLHLRKRLDLPEGQITKHSRIMVVESGNKILGMLVDSVSQVLRIPASSVDLPPEEVEQVKACVRGIGKVDARLIMIMDLGKALAKDSAAGGAMARKIDRL